MDFVQLVGPDPVLLDRVLADAVGSDLGTADGVLEDLGAADPVGGDLGCPDGAQTDLRRADRVPSDLQAADAVRGDLRLADRIELDFGAADAVGRDLRPRTASDATSGLPTPSVAISEPPTEFLSRSMAASPPPLLSSSRTSAERTPLVSEMSFDLTSPLTMSSLNTVPVAGSATAVPLRATKRAR